jgi:hypothetical protein
MRVRVGRVEVGAETGRAVGTGFLIGPDLVLTADVVVGAAPPQALAVRFDEVRVGSTVREGIRFAVREVVGLIAIARHYANLRQ